MNVKSNVTDFLKETAQSKNIGTQC